MRATESKGRYQLFRHGRSDSSPRSHFSQSSVPQGLQKCQLFLQFPLQESFIHNPQQTTIRLEINGDDILDLNYRLHALNNCSHSSCKGLTDFSRHFFLSFSFPFLYLICHLHCLTSSLSLTTEHRVTPRLYEPLLSLSFPLDSQGP